MTLIHVLFSALLATPALVQDTGRLPDADQSGSQRVSVSVFEEAYVVDVTIYDIEDLSVALSPTATPEDEDPAAALQREKNARRQAAERLGQAVRDFVEPAWRGEVNVLQHAGSSSLVVSGTQEQHKWIASFLTGVRQVGDQMLFGQVHYIEVPRGHLSKLGVTTPTSLLWTDEVQKLLKRAMLAEDVSVMNGPRVLMRPATTASVSILTEVAYVKSYDVRLIAPEQVLIADPVIDTVQEGYTLVLSGVPLPGGLYGATIKFDRSAIQRPIETREIRLATNPESTATISSPVVTHVSISSKVLMELGQSVAFSTPANDEDRDLLVVVTMVSFTPALQRLQALGYVGDQED